MKDTASEALPLPFSTEAEQQVLGGLLLNNALWHKISGFLKAEHFFDPVHARVFEHIVGRISADKLASPVTLQADLAGDDGLKELGGPGYLVRMQGASVSSFAIVDYAQMIVELHKRREMLTLCEQITASVHRDEDASVSLAEMELFLHQQEPTGEPRSMSLLKAHIEAIDDVMSVRDGDSPAIPSGLASLDKALSMRRQRYTILAGGTSMGKTAKALSITYAAASAGFGVGFVSREMPERDLAARLNSMDSRVPYKAFEHAMSDTVVEKVVRAAKEQEQLPIEIFSARVDDMPAILSEAKKLKHKWSSYSHIKGLGLLVIDYIQLIKGQGSSFEVLSAVANELKQVAKLLDVHVLALAQIDRKVMERDNPRPQLSDLRGSGDLENAPDNVVFCFREEYFLERKPVPKKTEDMADHIADLEASRGRMELIVAKARMGEIGSITVGCDMATNRFWDLGQTEELDF